MTVDRKDSLVTGKCEPQIAVATAEALNLDALNQEELLALLASIPTAVPNTDVTDSGDTTIYVNKDYNSMYQNTFQDLTIFLGELPISMNSYLKFGDGGGAWTYNGGANEVDPYGRDTSSGQSSQAPAGFFLSGAVAYGVFFAYGQTAFTNTSEGFPYAVGLLNSVNDAYVWSMPADNFITFSVNDKLDAYADNYAGAGGAGVNVHIVWEPKTDVIRRVLARKYGTKC